MAMPMLTQPSFGPRTALTYVTIGSLLDVWTGVWYFAFHDHAFPLSHTAKFWMFGLFLTGLTLVVIGVLLGPLGRSARKVEMPPVGVAEAEARIQQTAAANPQPVVAPARPVATPAQPVVANSAPRAGTAPRTY
jgi:hypothetical protein